jgi:hypothetical protein
MSGPTPEQWLAYVESVTLQTATLEDHDAMKRLLREYELTGPPAAELQKIAQRAAIVGRARAATLNADDDENDNADDDEPLSVRFDGCAATAECGLELLTITVVIGGASAWGALGFTVDLYHNDDMQPRMTQKGVARVVSFELHNVTVRDGGAYKVEVKDNQTGEQCYTPMWHGLRIEASEAQLALLIARDRYYHRFQTISPLLRIVQKDDELRFPDLMLKVLLPAEREGVADPHTFIFIADSTPEHGKPVKNKHHVSMLPLAELDTIRDAVASKLACVTGEAIEGFAAPRVVLEVMCDSLGIDLASAEHKAGLARYARRALIGLIVQAQQQMQQQQQQQQASKKGAQRSPIDVSWHLDAGADDADDVAIELACKKLSLSEATIRDARSAGERLYIVELIDVERQYATEGADELPAVPMSTIAPNLPGVYRAPRVGERFEDPALNKWTVLVQPPAVGGGDALAAAALRPVVPTQQGAAFVLHGAPARFNTHQLTTRNGMIYDGGSRGPGGVAGGVLSVVPPEIFAAAISAGIAGVSTVLFATYRRLWLGETVNWKTVAVKAGKDMLLATTLGGGAAAAVRGLAAIGTGTSAAAGAALVVVNSMPLLNLVFGAAFFGFGVAYELVRYSRGTISKIELRNNLIVLGTSVAVCTAVSIAAGAALGALFGSILPGAGTIIGAILGALLGCFFGSVAAKKANEYLSLRTLTQNDMQCLLVLGVSADGWLDKADQIKARAKMISLYVHPDRIQLQQAADCDRFQSIVNAARDRLLSRIEAVK